MVGLEPDLGLLEHVDEAAFVIAQMRPLPDRYTKDSQKTWIVLPRRIANGSARKVLRSFSGNHSMLASE